MLTTVVLMFSRWSAFIVRFWTSWTEQKDLFQMKNNDSHNYKKRKRSTEWEAVGAGKAQGHGNSEKETRISLLAKKLCTF